MMQQKPNQYPFANPIPNDLGPASVQPAHGQQSLYSQPSQVNDIPPSNASHEKDPREKKEHKKHHFWRNYFIISGILFNVAVLVLLIVRLLVYINTFMPAQ